MHIYIYIYICLFALFFETGSYMLPRLALISWASCLILKSAGNSGVCPHAGYQFWESVICGKVCLKPFRTQVLIMVPLVLSSPAIILPKDPSGRLHLRRPVKNGLGWAAQGSCRPPTDFSTHGRHSGEKSQWLCCSWREAHLLFPPSC
jgi:hypothetical protein